MHQQVSSDDILLGLSRLLDPSSQGSYKKISLERLRDCVAAIGNTTLVADFDKAFASFEQHKNAIAESHRNKRLAHNDLQTILGENILPPIVVKQIEETLSALREAMNIVQLYLENTATGYEHYQGAAGGVDTMISILQEHAKRQDDQLRDWGLMPEE